MHGSQEIRLLSPNSHQYEASVDCPSTPIPRWNGRNEGDTTHAAPTNAVWLAHIKSASMNKTCQALLRRSGSSTRFYRPSISIVDQQKSTRLIRPFSFASSCGVQQFDNRDDGSDRSARPAAVFPCANVTGSTASFDDARVQLTLSCEALSRSNSLRVGGPAALKVEGKVDEAVSAAQGGGIACCRRFHREHADADSYGGWLRHHDSWRWR
jgi:hypothetical protein